MERGGASGVSSGVAPLALGALDQARALFEAVPEEGQKSPSAPDVVERELVRVAGRQDVRIDEGARIVGFSASSDAESAFDEVSSELVGKGWVSVDSGSGRIGSFVKATGELGWAGVACSEVGEVASVVIQYEFVERGGR